MRHALLCVLLCGCPEQTPAPCERACDTLTRHECAGYLGSPGEDGRYGTADDVSCVDVCENYAAIEPERAMKEAECLATLESCGGLSACVEGAERDLSEIVAERDRYKTGLEFAADLAEEQQERAEEAEKRLAECEGDAEVMP